MSQSSALAQKQKAKDPENMCWTNKQNESRLMLSPFRVSISIRQISIFELGQWDDKYTPTNASEHLLHCSRHHSRHFMCISSFNSYSLLRGLLLSFSTWWNCFIARGIRWDQRIMKAWPKTEKRSRLPMVTWSTDLNRRKRQDLNPSIWLKTSQSYKHHYTTSGRDYIYLPLYILPVFQNNRFSAVHIATLNKNYISQPSLQLGVVIRLNMTKKIWAELV